MWTQPQPSRLRTPAERQRDQRDVAGHAHTMSARHSAWIPRLVATPEGKVWAVLTIASGQVLTDDWPATMHMPRLHLPHPGKMQADIDRLTQQQINYPVQRLVERDGTGRSLWAQAQFIGFTEAVPLAVHDTTDQWLCIGGKITQQPRPYTDAHGQPAMSAEVQFTLQTQRYPRQTGLIGLLYTLAANDPQANVVKVDWAFQTQLQPTGFTTADQAVFCPLWAVNAAQGRIANLGLQMPFAQHPRWTQFNPAAPTGTILGGGA